MFLTRHIPRCTSHLPRSIAACSTASAIKTDDLSILQRLYPTQTQESTQSLWSHIPRAAPDSILGITEDFKKCQNINKINLSVGAYRDDLGKPYVLPSIKLASEILFEQEENKEYTGINGSSNYNTLVQKFLFGNAKTGKILYDENRISTCQSLSGTGALKIAGEFLNKWSPYESRKIYLPNPTWANHVNIFQNSGLTPEYFTYLDPKTKSINIKQLITDLENAEVGSSVLLHSCCHNPTGLDPTLDQWNQIIQVLKDRSLIPIIDIAYQGFQSGDLQKDSFLLELINQEIYHGNLPTAIICQSFAKNMGLYGERIGSLSIITENSKTTKTIDSQLKKIIRSMYSSPSIHGSKLVEIVLSNPDIFKQWETDVLEMSNRIKSMRTKLHSYLKDSSMNWDHLIKQHGMFCYTGLSAKQITKLAEDWGVFATLDGRFSISGINNNNVEYLANAIKHVTGG